MRKSFFFVSHFPLFLSFFLLEFRVFIPVSQKSETQWVPVPSVENHSHRTPSLKELNEMFCKKNSWVIFVLPRKIYIQVKNGDDSSSVISFWIVLLKVILLFIWFCCELQRKWIYLCNSCHMTQVTKWILIQMFVYIYIHTGFSLTLVITVFKLL